MQGYRFKAPNSPVYCINADNMYQANYVFVEEMKHHGWEGPIHPLGYGKKWNTDTYIVAEFYIPVAKPNSIIYK